MRNRSIISPESSSARVNVTPMIDVVMVLIVFYLLVGQLALDRRAAINLPQTRTGAEDSQQTDPIVVGVTLDGTSTLNGRPIDPDRLGNQITGMLSAAPGTPIRVRADRRAPYSAVRPVLDDLRALGIGEVQLVTEQRP
ncbi:MAG: biopolymer transporter ExbD [Phycisphaerales bacterium]